MYGHGGYSCLLPLYNGYIMCIITISPKHAGLEVPYLYAFRNGHTLGLRDGRLQSGVTGQALNFVKPSQSKCLEGHIQAMAMYTYHGIDCYTARPRQCTHFPTQAIALYICRGIARTPATTAAVIAVARK